MDRESLLYAETDLIVDYFAGGGGASEGIRTALRRNVNVAINHCPAAIAMHEANHPETKHLKENVWDVDPVRDLPQGPVCVAWFSPTCTHFSRARGKPSARPTGPAPRRPRRGRRNTSTVMPQIDWLMLTDPSDGESFWNLGAAGGFTVPRPIRFLPHIRELAAMLERGEITEEQAVGACEVSAFLRKHLGIEFASPFVTIQGQAYIIVDIQLRMLTPRELARAQGFSDDYILTGTQEQQVARIGNSVSPPVAQALVQANAPSPMETSS